MTLSYYAGDERPYWEATVRVNGAVDDMTTGYTFEVNIATRPTSTPVLTKTTGITGGPAGLVTVAWQGTNLNLAAGSYYVQLTATRTSDNAEWTVQDRITVKTRLT